MRITRIKADTSALEKQIDEMVYALYGLTPEEIAKDREKYYVLTSIRGKIVTFQQACPLHLFNLYRAAFGLGA
jgi:hypothetical protein